LRSTVEFSAAKCDDMAIAAHVSDLQNAALRIFVTSSESLGDLVTYLTRCGCDVEIVGPNVVEASAPPGISVTPAHLKTELDGYLRVWRILNPGVGAEVLASPPPEPAAAQPGGR
jgi:hypothetical protein